VDWAVPQLEAAADIARRVAGERGHPSMAAELYREWFNPLLDVASENPLRRPLPGVYRGAHAGSRAQFVSDGLDVVDRFDVVGRDGWWRTWNEAWVPTRSRCGAVRVLFSPRPTSEDLESFVSIVTTHLRAEPMPWLLACATDPRRLRRMAAAVLYLPNAQSMPEQLLADLRPTLTDATPPLCLRLDDGAALAEYPTNGMSFGEHRCHLVALALRPRAARRDPLPAIAQVFESHGLDPSAPHRSATELGGPRG
jgi:hypothetical protein